MAKIEHQPLNDRAYQEIRKGLTTGLFAPMQPLVIRTLATSYGISATPIREALQRLVAERLLVVLPNRSIVVPRMTKAHFLELLQIRVAVEGLAAELATPKLTAKDFVKFDKFLQRIATTIETSDAKAYLSLNRDFHFAIYEKSENQELLHMVQHLWLKAGPVFTRLFDDDDYRHQANNEHANIIEALSRGDAKAARASVEMDLTAAANVLVKFLPDDESED
ncbi:transcriptional regulator, GntR family [Arboricoccus pini]|uniref:Transcriptional regulator, GntR family n=1 Tax=Arboricoccus pini TaxID=1963835 RepID=A0A212Q0N2_9PROT|nr:GntR family transcriptional regulator [Arboricoccus pini]SNB52748.1 transcriptional regulator, GntR family [Arboricoccus pini]